MGAQKLFSEPVCKLATTSCFVDAKQFGNICTASDSAWRPAAISSKFRELSAVLLVALTIGTLQIPACVATRILPEDSSIRFGRFNPDNWLTTMFEV